MGQESLIEEDEVLLV